MTTCHSCQKWIENEAVSSTEESHTGFETSESEFIIRDFEFVCELYVQLYCDIYSF